MAETAAVLATGQTIVDQQGVAYISNPNQHVILRAQNALTAPLTIYTGVKNTPGSNDGGLLQAKYRQPTGIALGPDGRLWVADRGNQAIRRVGGQNVATMILPADARAAAGVTQFGAYGVAFFDNGKMLISDPANYVLWLYDIASKLLRVFAGKLGVPGIKDGSGEQARFQSPGLAQGRPGSGLIGVTDKNNSIVRLVERTGNVSTLGVAG